MRRLEDMYTSEEIDLAKKFSIGIPYSVEEILQNIKLIKSTSPITNEEIKELGKRLANVKNAAYVPPSPEPGIKSETIERAQRVLAMLMVLQSEIDELKTDKLFFIQGLKNAGNNFAFQLDHQIKVFYDAMDHDANVYYNQQIICLEELLKAYMQNKITVTHDSEI